MNKITFSQETRQAVHAAQNGRCKISVDRIDDFHHRVPNTKANQAKYPLFLNSPLNCVGLSRAVHDSGKIYTELTQISDKEAAMYEEWLQGLKEGKP